MHFPFEVALFQHSQSTVIVILLISAGANLVSLLHSNYLERRIIESRRLGMMEGQEQMTEYFSKIFGGKEKSSPTQGKVPLSDLTLLQLEAEIQLAVMNERYEWAQECKLELARRKTSAK